MKIRLYVSALAILIMALAVTTPETAAQRRHENAVIDIWAEGKTAFGVYAPTAGQPLPSDPRPTAEQQTQQQAQGIQQQIDTLQTQLQQVRSGARGAGGQGARGGGGGRGANQAQQQAPRYTREIGEALARNPLYDFVFLNLEGSFSIDAVHAIVAGLRSSAAVSRKTLIVRIPSINDAGAELTKYRVKDIFDAGADAVAIPHVEGLEQAEQAISFFAAATNNLWTPDNPSGEKLGMIMIEDPATLAISDQIAALKGYSMLACGVGSLGGAFNAEGVVRGLTSLGLLPANTPSLGELGTKKILAETKKSGLANMITASQNNIEGRVNDKFEALLFSGAGSDDIIRQGRTMAGRQ